ncbi:MAG: CAP domain-containing protein [Yoonia sp.]
MILNSLRIDNGVGSVSYDRRLDAAAQGHAEDMASNGYFRMMQMGMMTTVLIPIWSVIV